jgi:hypothetical protein
MKTTFERMILSFAVIVLTGVTVTVILFFRELIPMSSTALVSWLSISLSLIVLTYSFLFVRIAYRNPTSLVISLLGFPNSGKTVFLTVLFNELQAADRPTITFSPYGIETVEQVARNLNTLFSGSWLGSTSPSGVFFFRANAAIASRVFRRRFKIEIGDYAGEHMKEFDTKDERWLHKTEYFKYVVQSDAIFLVIDTEVLLSKSRLEVETMQNAMIAALQLLLESKGVGLERKLQAPLALLFMKVDLLPRYLLEDSLTPTLIYVSDLTTRDFKVLPATVSRLIDLCERKCANFNVFFVSAVGRLGPNDSPPSELKPFQVTDPLAWALQRV